MEGHLLACLCFVCSRISFLARPFPPPAAGWAAGEELAIVDHVRTKGLCLWEALAESVSQTTFEASE